MKQLLHKTPIWLKKLYPDFVWQVETKEKKLFLTFDDGPIPEVTEFVLDTLKKFNAKATFFCVGENLTKHPSIARQIVDHGQVIGNHTYNHLRGWQTSTANYIDNVEKGETELLKFHNSRRLFRPPYGRIKRSQAAELQGYKIVMWNRLAWDFDKNLNTERAIKHLNDDAPRGSIFVFHDNIKSFQKMKVILPEVLRHYSNLGFEFDVLS